MNRLSCSCIYHQFWHLWEILVVNKWWRTSNSFVVNPASSDWRHTRFIHAEHFPAMKCFTTGLGPDFIHRICRIYADIMQQQPSAITVNTNAGGYRLVITEDSTHYRALHYHCGLQDPLRSKSERHCRLGLSTTSLKAQPPRCSTAFHCWSYPVWFIAPPQKSWWNHYWW